MSSRFAVPPSFFRNFLLHRWEKIHVQEVTLISMPTLELKVFTADQCNYHLLSFSQFSAVPFLCRVKITKAILVTSRSGGRDKLSQNGRCIG